MIFFFHCADTCSLTLAVSRGNVNRSATQAAAPALAIFTPSGGGTSEGFSPTMFPNTGVTDTHRDTQSEQETTTHTLTSHNQSCVQLKRSITAQIDDKNILTVFVQNLKVPLDLVAGQDLIGQIIIHKGCHSAERKDASLALCLYIVWPGFFMTSTERRYCVLLYARVKSKSTDCQKVNVQFSPWCTHISEKQLVYVTRSGTLTSLSLHPNCAKVSINHHCHSKSYFFAIKYNQHQIHSVQYKQFPSVLYLSLNIK